MPLDVEPIEDVEELGTHSVTPKTGDSDGVVADPLGASSRGPGCFHARCSSSSDEGGGVEAKPEWKRRVSGFR